MENQTPQTPPVSKSPVKLIVLILVAAAAIAALVWYGKFYPRSQNRTNVPNALNSGSGAPSSAAAAPTSSLGAQLYQSANNPVQNKLPSTVAPVPNPIQNVYKNPFE